MRKRPREPHDFVPCGDPRRIAAGEPPFRSMCQYSCCIKPRKGSSDEDESDGEDDIGDSCAEAVGASSALVVGLPPFSLVSNPAGRAALHAKYAHGSSQRKADILWQALTRKYPLHHASDPTHDAVAEKLRRMEKYEIALQGDDYADRDAQKTNTEALSYAKAAASVMAMSRPRLSELCAGSRTFALEKLKEQPFIGAFRASQIRELALTGTCQALAAFERDDLPVGSDGIVRVFTQSGRSMRGAHSKRALCKVLGISAVRAAELWEGAYRELPQIRTVEQLRNLPSEHVIKLLRRPSASGDRPASGDGGALVGDAGASAVDAAPADDSSEVLWSDPSRSNFTFGLAHHEELQEPIPPREAEQMRADVLSIVRAQQGCSGCACRCTRSFTGDGGEHAVTCAGCDCCWHVEFVGGAPRRGVAGHDVDLLVWHRQRASSWARGREGCVLGTLITELEARASRGEGGLVPRKHGWQMPKLAHEKRLLKDGVRAHRRDVSACTGTSHGFENLSMDSHDKVFGVWRTREGRHRRIDIVVNSFPEELALARLTWTGSRLLNRMMRLHAQHNGLSLTAHALLVTQSDLPLLIRDNETGEVARIPAAGQPTPVEVPYKYLGTERDIIFLLGGCTDAFFGLLDPRNRNA